jgi:hypothetical protein
MSSLWKISLAAGFLAMSTACSVGLGQPTEDTRKLELDAGGIQKLHIRNGDGTLHVIGDPALTSIQATAELSYQGISEDKLRLSLEQSGSAAELNAYFENRISIGYVKQDIDLTVRVPEKLLVSIEDGDGSILAEKLKADLAVDDGDGDLAVKDTEGGISIKDGDGAITLKNVKGGFSIDDGDGDIQMSRTAGPLTMTDGDGSITASGHDGSFTIASDGDGAIELADVTGDVSVKDGDGGLVLSGIGGNVEITDGDGDIRIDGVEKDVVIKSAGDGAVKTDHVKGKVTKP